MVTPNQRYENPALHHALSSQRTMRWQHVRPLARLRKARFGFTSLLFCLIFCLIFWHVKPIQATEAPEYQVKAAFLYNFTKFVEWPKDTFAQENSPFIIGVLGTDPFGAHLDKTVDGKALDEHKITVKRFKRFEDLQSCHLLFVSRSEKDKLPKIVERLAKTNTLIVGDMEGFLQRGGAINFIIEDKKVRFEINMDVAERAGLKISSRLLQLATKVIRR